MEAEAFLIDWRFFRAQRFGKHRQRSKRQRRDPSQPGPKAQEKSSKNKGGLKARAIISQSLTSSIWPSALDFIISLTWGCAQAEIAQAFGPFEHDERLHIRQEADS